MSRSAREYLQHILDETDYILEHSRDVSFEAFANSQTLKRAFVRSLEVIGEASKQIPDELRVQYGHIAWRTMAGMRDRLIHGYFGIDYAIVWDVIANKIPQLHTDITQMLNAEAPANETTE